MYIYQNPAWPYFVWNVEKIQSDLLALKYAQGKMMGKLEALGFHLREETSLEILTEDVIKTSEIEGERLNLEEVRSSLAKRLGIEDPDPRPRNRNVDGIVEVMCDATQNAFSTLTRERLFAWHAALFPTGYSGLSQIRVGALRDDSHGRMQVVSGRIGKETVHFQAPLAKILEQELNQFLAWLNDDVGLDPILKAAIAHLWFVTLHPFDDGNGRIARAIADMMLTRSDGVSKRFYSMSSQIQKERKTYYLKLEETQKGTMDITLWLEWFLDCLKHAIENSQLALNRTLEKTHFWENLKGIEMNERQRKMINLLTEGFEGVLNTSKWARICKCSQDTALRDIQDLVAKGILQKNESGGRSTNYMLFFS